MELITINRVHLQSAIISAILNENAFSSVRDIIGSANIKSINSNAHHEVWKIFEELYPSQEINIISVSTALKKHSLSISVVGFSTYVCSSNTIKLQAVQLLELDIYEKIIENLDSARSDYLGISDTIKAGYTADIIEHLRSDTTDLFDVTQVISSFVKEKELDKCHFIFDYQDALKRKTLNIKKEASIDSLYVNLLSSLSISESTDHWTFRLISFCRTYSKGFLPTKNQMTQIQKLLQS